MGQIYHLFMITLWNDNRLKKAAETAETSEAHLCFYYQDDGVFIRKNY